MCIAVPGQVVSLGKDTGLSRPARVSVLGVERDVDLVMVPGAAVGDYVVVHSGYAIEIIPELRARQTLELLAADEGR
jgi:hydrogenase expression/formation protein HypC